MDEIVLKSTGAIGDIIIASALQAALAREGYKTGVISKAFTLPLWDGLEDVAVYEVEAQVKGAEIVDISDYSRHLPHLSKLPAEFAGVKRVGHLCEWMAYELSLQSGHKLDVSRDDIRIILDEKEMDFGKKEVDKYRSGENPTVVITPYKGTQNRDLPLESWVRITQGLKDLDATILQLVNPFAKEPLIEGCYPIGDKDLRKVAAIVGCADAFIGTDSGPLHLMNGVLQGCSWDPWRDTVIVACGSSNPEVICYEGNGFASSSLCPVSPCGAHGYIDVGEYGARLGREFHVMQGDEARTTLPGCAYKSYVKAGVAPCMAYISTDGIVQQVQRALENR